MSGATLFEVMLFPNLIGAALFTPFVVKEFKTLYRRSSGHNAVVYAFGAFGECG
ncbi:MAG: hypothetical protein ACLU99_06840 [Alphaproteobacteria bacterium]